MNTAPSSDRAPAPLYGDTALYGGGWYGAPPSGLAWLSPRRILRKWRIVAAVTAFMLAVAAGYLWIAPNVYQGAGLLELSVRRPRILAQQAAVIEDPSSSAQSAEVFNTRLERFKGRTMLMAALERLDAACPGAFYPPPQLLPTEADTLDAEARQKRRARLHEARLNQFKKALHMELVRRSRMIRVEFEHTDPVVAAAGCNVFMEAAAASAHDENRTSSDAAVVWLEAQADLQRKELLKAEDALVTFRQKHNIDALESQRKTVEDALLEFNRSLVNVESQEAQQQALISKLDQLDLDPERAGHLPAELPRAEEIRAALEQWRVAVVERDSLLTTHTPKHPEVQARENMMTLYRQQALQALERATATARANHRLLQDQAESLRRKKDEQIQLAAKLEIEVVEHKTRLAALERARDAADQAFRGILTRIQEARLAADENTATVKIVEPANTPMHPVRPNRLRLLALAVFLGVLGGIGLVTLADIVEDRVTAPEDFEGRGVPVLAVVPHVRNVNRSDLATATIHHRHSELVEAFAGLANMLDSPRHREQSKVILVASSIPSEGKTVTSCNLAAALARRGRRVLLVDFDLRRPQLAGLFPLPPGRATLLDALTRSSSEFARLCYPAAECRNLDVIASRPVSGARPSDAVGAPMAAALVAWAKERYDHVILDAPPLGLVSDTLALAPLADSTLVMVRPEVSRKRLAWHTIHRLKESGIQALAVVVNDLDISKMLYGSYSPYYHYQQNYKTYATEPDPAHAGDPSAAQGARPTTEA